MRASLVDELLGADYSVHNILHDGVGIESAVDVLSKYHDVQTGLEATGKNLGDDFLNFAFNLYRPTLSLFRTLNVFREQLQRQGISFANETGSS